MTHKENITKRKTELLATLELFLNYKTVLEYETNRPSNPPNGQMVRCYLKEVGALVSEIVVYAPSKLNDFQVWTVDTNSFFYNIKAIPSEIATWGGN